MNLLFKHYVHPWNPGDVVPATTLTPEQLDRLTRAGAVQSTVAAVNVSSAPAAEILVKPGYPWWFDDPTLQVWDFTGSNNPVPVSAADERYVIVGYSLIPLNPTSHGILTAGGPVTDPEDLENRYYVALAPDTYDYGAVVGPGVDLGSVSTLIAKVRAVMLVGSGTGDSEVGVIFQQSPDNSNWSSVSGEADGGIPTQDTGSPKAVANTFPRTQRYVRAQCAIDGEEGATATFSVLFFTEPDPSAISPDAVVLLTCNGSQTLPLGSVFVPTEANRGVYANNLRGWVATVRQTVA